MITVSVLYPDGTESTFHASDIDSFIASVMGGADSVAEKGLVIAVDGVKHTSSVAKVVEPKPTSSPDLPPPAKRSKKAAA